MLYCGGYIKLNYTIIGEFLYAFVKDLFILNHNK